MELNLLWREKRYQCGRYKYGLLSEANNQIYNKWINLEEPVEDLGEKFKRAVGGMKSGKAPSTTNLTLAHAGQPKGIFFSFIRFTTLTLYLQLFWVPCLFYLTLQGYDGKKYKLNESILEKVISFAFF